MEKRIKHIRETLGMTQHEFAKALGMGQSTLAMIETGQRNILLRHIKTICSVFNISEDWLKTGEGDMFSPQDSDPIAKVAKQYHMDERGRAMLEVFAALPPESMEIILDVARRLVNAADSIPAPVPEINIDEEVESYRRQLLEEKKARTSSALPDTDAETEKA